MPFFIRKIKKHCIQPIREDGPQSHIHTKKQKPTMGGILFVPLCIIVSLLMMRPCPWGKVIAMSTLLNGAIGAVDDWLKIKKKNSKGLAPSLKTRYQFLVAFVIVYWVYRNLGPNAHFLRLPFIQPIPLNRFFFFVIGLFLMIGSCNAVNLTDGLDGLAVGPTVFSSIGLGIVAFFVEKTLGIDHAKEMTIFMASLAGSCLGFLWYNKYPSRIIMGDCGSMAIGGCLASVALIVRHEWFLGIAGIVFVMETLSVMIQVAVFKRTKKRVFLMTPIHHHFEVKGWTEKQIVKQFWMISCLFLFLALFLLRFSI